MPTTKSELRAFLGLCNVNRLFIEGFAHITQPLNKLLCKGSLEEFTLNHEQQDAFKAFVKRICSPPILAFTQASLRYSLDTDASAYGIWCTLFQINEDAKRKPKCFLSRTLNSAEPNYSASERECLAVVWDLQLLRPYPQYKDFTVFMDNHELHWLMNVSEASGQLTR